MALEKRNGNYYYYKKEREGSRVLSRYYGKGELSGIVAQLDQLEREEREFKAAKTRFEREKVEEIDQELSEIERNSKSLTRLHLESKGFYQTASREWRHRKQK
ncbi:MAG: hypothetical protein M3388_16605 [Acidobacteriota bacterium]|nr:hypothetical protein [Acidobacteriota bacterium]